jgi:adenosylcobyric acid synthase
MTARTLMIQGTMSSAGKSLLTAAFCRIFARRGLGVAPFKAQNMSNNAAVCAGGLEIGRAQALQAAAARVAPRFEMNPILLKPEGDARSQVIVRGRPWKTLPARGYYEMRDELWPVVTEALDRLRGEYELVVIEGAGSPAEMNLREADIVNMAVARHCASPVLLVGDIERGGVFAQLLGTLWLLEPDDRRLVRGLIVNKFRGDCTLFDDGVEYLQKRGEVPVLGVVPWLPGLDLPEEDGQPLECSSPRSGAPDDGSVEIVVIRLPHIANFDDFDPLAAESGVALRYVDSPDCLGRPHAVVLPGTKSTIGDLKWLRSTGLAGLIVELAGTGTAIIGICGGYQMLGSTIRDPERVESTVAEAPGLGLLPIETIFSGTKETHQARACVTDDRHCPGSRGMSLTGYEIHHGDTRGGTSWLTIRARCDVPVEIAEGAVSDDARIWGCYLHGLFANDGFRRNWLNSLQENGGRRGHPNSPTPTAERLEAALDRLADAVEASVDMPLLEQIVFSSDTILPSPPRDAETPDDKAFSCPQI